MEEWNKAKNFSKYEISTCGEVRNLKGKILYTHIQNYGYEMLRVVNDEGIPKNMLVHRLVAMAFLTNYEEFPTVNHIDGNKLNNTLSNLEWCSYSHNLLHARRLGLNPYNTPTLGLKHKSNVSIYHNVGYDNARGKWNCGVRYKGKNYGQKRFNTEVEAALHVNLTIDKYNIPDRPKNIIDEA